MDGIRVTPMFNREGVGPQDSEQSRKRARVDDADDEEENRRPGHANWRYTKPASGPRSKHADVLHEPKFERDPDYFNLRDDALIYTCVKNFIFKSHLSTFQCCESMVRDIHRHEEVHGPLSEEKPFLFPTSVDLDEYKAFLWVNYAKDPELRQQPENDESIKRLFLIASMTKKFHIPKLSDWVSEKIKGIPRNSILLDSCSSDQFQYIIHSCITHKFPDLLEKVEEAWCKRVIQGSIGCVPAIQASDTYSLKHLKGVAYYQYIKDVMGSKEADKTTGAMKFDANFKLTKDQTLRALNGYWSLVSMWEHLKSNPITLPMSSVCNQAAHKEECQSIWKDRWAIVVRRERIQTISSSDIVGLLKMMEDQLRNDMEDPLNKKKWEGAPQQCRISGLTALKDLNKKVEMEIASHFVDPVGFMVPPTST